MKILHVITGLGIGGAELQLRAVLRHTRHEADVLTLYNRGPVADMLCADGVRVRDLEMRSNTQVSALPRLQRLIRAGRYDVVHAHLYRAQVYGRLAARLAGTPVVVSTEHSIGETHLERRRMNAGVRALYLATERCGQATIAVSDTVRDRLVRWGVPARRITVIPNGVDLSRAFFDAPARERVRRQLGIARDATVIGVLGRLDPNKRFDLAMEAAAPLLSDRRLLLVVGDGEDRQRLHKLAAELGVTERVVFTGERRDVAAMLSAMDLFLATSAQETFGLSVLEALCTGLPVLYTTCPALEGVHTDRARQVPGEVSALCEHIAAALADGTPTREPVAEVRQRYGMDAVSGRIDELYERLFARRRGAAVRACPTTGQPAFERGER